jgi:hypothetical protein
MIIRVTHAAEKEIASRSEESSELFDFVYVSVISDF